MSIVNHPSVSSQSSAVSRPLSAVAKVLPTSAGYLEGGNAVPLETAAFTRLTRGPSRPSHHKSHFVLLFPSS